MPSLSAFVGWARWYGWDDSLPVGAPTRIYLRYLLPSLLYNPTLDLKRVPGAMRSPSAISYPYWLALRPHSSLAVFAPLLTWRVRLLALLLR